MELSKAELERILDEKIDRALKESDERMERYIGILKEDSDDKLQAIFEYVKDIPGMKEDITTLKGDVRELKTDVSILKVEMKDMKNTQDVMFDKVGEIAEDVEVIKEGFKDHEQRLQRIEI